jgi:serine/threonine protein kinase
MRSPHETIAEVPKTKAAPKRKLRNYAEAVPGPGEPFDGYTIDKELGRGGSATVYLAHPTDNDTDPVALKLLHADRHTPAELAQLHREFDRARRLDHPHIVTMYDRGPDWLTMQYVDGGNSTTLHTLGNRLAALAQVADALDYTHRIGIVHCDVKPANILVFEHFSDGGAILVDFGVAHSMAEDAQLRLARHPVQTLSLDPARRIAQQPPDRPAQVQASLPYAAPELLLGQQPSGATDEYALACTAVELITGKLPFVATTPVGLVEAQLRHPPPRVSHQVSWIPRAFDSILAKAMAKNPDARYGTCAEFVRLITRALR